MHSSNSNPHLLGKKSSLLFNKENIQPMSLRHLHKPQKSLKPQKTFP